MIHQIRYALVLIGLLLVTNSWAELKDFNGTPHKLEDYVGKGKWTVVMFWASDCRVCNAEIGQYIQFNDTHKDKDASILGISLDGQSRMDDARAFIKRHDVNFPNLVGEPDEIVNIYQNLTSNEWLGTPSFLVYNPEGKLLAAQAGAVPTELIVKFIKENTETANKSQ